MQRASRSVGTSEHSTLRGDIFVAGGRVTGINVLGSPKSVTETDDRRNWAELKVQIDGKNYRTNIRKGSGYTHDGESSLLESLTLCKIARFKVIRRTFLWRQSTRGDFELEASPSLTAMQKFELP